MSLPSRACAAVLAGLSALAACSAPTTAVIVNVEALQGVGDAADLYVRFAQQNDNRDIELAATDGTVFPPGSKKATFVIRAAGREGSAEITVIARDTEQRSIGEGHANVVLVANEQVFVTVRLNPTDFQINSASGDPPGKGNQFFTTTAPGRHVASDEKGNFVVVWEDSCPAPEPCRLFARLFDHLGNPRLRAGKTEEFVASESRDDNYDMPAVAAQKDGSFVLVSKRYPAIQQDKGHIFVRAFQADGAPNADNSSELQLSASTGVERASTPDVAALPGTSSAYVAVWQQKKAGFETTEIAAMLLTGNGKPQGGQIIVGSFPHASAIENSCESDTHCLKGEFCAPNHRTCQAIPASPAVSPGPEQVGGGGFMVVWNQNGDLKGRCYGIYNDSVDALSNTIDIASSPSGRVHGADIAVLPYGYVVIWADRANTGTDTEGTTIRIRRFDVVGNPLEQEFSLNTSAAGNQREPTLATRSDGHLLAVWATDQPAQEAHGVPGDPMGGIRARLLLGNGLPVGNDFRLNTTLPNSQMSPSIAPKPTQEAEPPGFIVVFVDTSASIPDVDGSGIRGRFFFPGTYSARDQQIGALCDENTSCGGNLYCASTQVGKRCVSTCQGQDAPCPNGGTCQQTSDTAQFVCTYLTAAPQ